MHRFLLVIHLAVLVQCSLVTDARTDRRMETRRQRGNNNNNNNSNGCRTDGRTDRRGWTKMLGAMAGLHNDVVSSDVHEGFN